MFEVHRLNAAGLDKAEKLRVAFQSALDQIEILCGAVCRSGERVESRGNNGRELALVRTHLETASFYAKRAMALCPENQEKP